jgi:hypothetical protein
MKKNIIGIIGALALLVLAVINPSITNATPVPVSPVYDSFGSLPDANFGGAGIPNGNVAKTITTTLCSD